MTLCTLHMVTHAEEGTLGTNTTILDELPQSISVPGLESIEQLCDTLLSEPIDVVYSSQAAIAIATAKELLHESIMGINIIKELFYPQDDSLVQKQIRYQLLKFLLYIDPVHYRDIDDHAYDHEKVCWIEVYAMAWSSLVTQLRYHAISAQKNHFSALVVGHAFITPGMLLLSHPEMYCMLADTEFKRCCGYSISVDLDHGVVLNATPIM